MNYLLDTCVICEVMRPKPDRKVLTWLESQDEESLYLSVLTFGEIEKGIEKSADGRNKNRLRLWVEEELKQRFAGRVLPIDMRVASRWGVVQGRLEAAGRPLPSINGLIAATGLVNNCVVVTRNIPDMRQSSVELYNPWTDSV